MQQLENSIGYKFQNERLLRQAMTHKSYHNEIGTDSAGHNEKLEFLGDSVLDLALSVLLLQHFPNDGEGNLSKKRASLVNEDILAQVARELNLNEILILGKGEISTGGALKPRLLASAFEALLGAMYLDAGYDRAFQLIEKCFTQHIQNLDPLVDYRSDYKSRLQEEVQKIYKEPPIYELEKEEGPPHERIFHVKLIVRKNVLSRGSGRSKRQAEQEAAKLAVEGKLYEKI